MTLKILAIIVETTEIEGRNTTYIKLIGILTSLP